MKPNPLTGTVEAEIRLYDRLLAIMKHERSAIISGNTLKLMEIIDKKRRLMSEIGGAAADRALAVGKRAAQLGFGTDVPSLKALAERMPKADATQLLERRSKLKERFQEIRTLNQRNSDLIQHAMTLVRNMRTFLENLKTPPEIYGRAGSIEAAHRTTGKMLSDKV